MYNKKIIIVIPCFKVKDKILDVILKVPKWVNQILCVDDCCPEESGKYIKNNIDDDRVIILHNNKNLGVGGASVVGFNHAKKLGAELIIKVDGDDQMDLSVLDKFVEPIFLGEADFVKGNRFTKFADYQNMPLARKLGNIGLSFFNRFSSGYWNLFDTTNGYLCFNAKLIDLLPIEKISKDYFFESDLLNWLYIIRAKVIDVPIKSIYNNEKSNINILTVILKFPLLYIRNFFRRFFYEYCLRNPDMKFISFLIGLLSLVFGIVFSLSVWKTSIEETPSASGTVAIALISIILGVNFISYFFFSDSNNYPKKTLTTI